MLLASATDLAISLAVKRGTVRITEHQSRHGLGPNARLRSGRRLG